MGRNGKAVEGANWNMKDKTEQTPDLSFLGDDLNQAIGHTLLGKWRYIKDVAEKHGVYPSRVQRARNKMIGKGIYVKPPAKYVPLPQSVVPFQIAYETRKPDKPLSAQMEARQKTKERMDRHLESRAKKADNCEVWQM